MVVLPTVVTGLLHGKLQKTGALTTFASISEMCHIFNKPPYYSFKIFPRFIIHHSQLLLTKFGENFVILNR